MGKNGGTQMYCSKCDGVTTCAAISLSQLNKRSSPCWYKIKHPDINWFERGRKCLSCGYKFVTSEVNKDFIDELTKLREKVTSEVDEDSIDAMTKFRKMFLD